MTAAVEDVRAKRATTDQRELLEALQKIAQHLEHIAEVQEELLRERLRRRLGLP